MCQTSGEYKFFLKRLAPELLALHNLDTMNISLWKNFAKKFDLDLLYCGYCGGFEPNFFLQD
ncbi:MAG: hypothetical protein ABI462_06685 [Ignavibacteria bacterium]